VTIGPSPDQVQMRLIAAGMRPVSNVVDVSNYVMLELGKPIHTFDARSVGRGDGGQATLIVRRARPGERLETLDHVERTLDRDTLLIADPQGPLGIAGVMGGANSEIGAETTDVLVESAVFDPVSIRRTGQRYGLRSEASLRFEKGQEFRLARIGADRTARLIGEWAGGTIARGRVDTAPDEPDRTRVVFRPARVNRLLGTDIAPDEQQSLLGRVGIETEAAHPAEMVTVALKPDLIAVEPETGQALAALVPTWRRDIGIEADVAEEIARVHGYEEVPSITPHTPMPSHRPDPLERRTGLRETLVGAGLSEVATFALVSDRHLAAFPADDVEPIRVTNPLSRDHSVLRQSLVGSLLEVAAANRRYGRSSVALFEVGKGYGRSADGPSEWWRLGMALAGPVAPPSWAENPRDWDLDDAKGIIELLARRLRLGRPHYRAATDAMSMHPGRTAFVSTDGSSPGIQGIVGEIHPTILEAWDVRADRVIVAELAIEGLDAGAMPRLNVRAPSRQPGVERDLAVVVDERQPAGEVEDTIRRHAGDHLVELRLFDIYRGSPLEPGQKSLAWRLEFQAQRTLGEDEIDAAIEAVTAGLQDELGARLRT
jgi:phenylalanyl-tRNA synthetase beta chain